MAVAWLTTLPSIRIVHVIEPGLCALITNTLEPLKLNCVVHGNGTCACCVWPDWALSV